MISLALDPERLDREVAQVLEILRTHLNELSNRAIKPSLQAGDLARDFASVPPESPRSIAEILEDFQTKVLPAVTHWQHPRFFAYYPATSSIPAILGELMMATLGSVGLQWSANPAATELECVVMDWLMKLLHAPDDSPFLHVSREGGGLIQNTAGEALAVIMVAARINLHRRDMGDALLTAEQLEQLYWQDSSSLVVYMSDQTHFAGPKAARVAGMRVHRIPARRLTSGNCGIEAWQVRSAMDVDRARGLTPCLVLLNHGSTNTCGSDDLASFAGLRQDLWVHVDAAYAGSALLLPEQRQRSLTLQEIASSFNFNGSKWLLCGFDSAFLFVRDRRLLKVVYAAGGDYMAKAQEEDIYNPEFKDWSIPLGRRFRALRIWMVLSYFGREGLEAYLRHSIAQADWLREQIDRSDVFEQVARTDLGLVCFTLKSRDPEATESFLERLNHLSEHGKHFLIYPSQIEGRRFLRAALGGIHTTEADLAILWQACLQAAQEVGVAPGRAPCPYPEEPV
jgi:aromatic-L-amino-acid decarboxylase